MITNILLLLIALGVWAMAFFIFCLWRSVMGKSSVDLKLAVATDLNTKKQQEVVNGLSHHSTVTDSLKKEISELIRLGREFKKQDDEKNA